MLRIFATSLRNRTLALIAGSMLFVALVSIVGLLRQQWIIGNYESLVKEELRLEKELLLLNSEFKTMVQEWKNTLIRGANSKDHDKYWGRFQQKLQDIPQQAGELRRQTNDLQLQQALDQFLADFQDMEKHYLAGHQRFLADGQDIHATDVLVRGIDRAPSEALLAMQQHLKEKNLARADELAAIAARTSAVGIPLVLLVLLVVLVASFWMLNMSLVRPTQSVLYHLQHLASKDFSSSITVSGDDELGRISSALRTMQQNISELLQQIKQNSEYIDATVAEARSANQTIIRNAEEVQSNTDQSATAITEMSSTVHEVANNASGAAAAAQQADASVAEGLKLMEEAMLSICDLANEVKNTTALMDGLERDANSISGVLDVVSSIAEQTNLLALNAAIEAARAGEQGRGFAVVADEVRTLAQRTQQSIEEISTIINNTQSAARNAVTAMRSGEQKADKTVELGRATEASINNISAEISRIKDMNIQIATAAEEQSAVSEEINRNIVNVARHTADNADAAKHCGQVSDQLSGVVSNLNSLVGQYTLPG